MNGVRLVRALARPPAALLKGADLDTSLAVGLLHTLAVGIVLWSALYFIVFLPFFVARKAVAGSMVGILATAAVTALILLHRCAADQKAFSSPGIIAGRVRRASWVLIGVTWLVTTAYAVLDGGAQSWALFVDMALIAAGTVLLGPRFAWLGCGLFSGISLIFSVLEHRGVVLPRYFPGRPLVLWYSVILVTGLIAFPVARMFATLKEALQQAREGKEMLRRMIERSQALNGQLLRAQQEEGRRIARELHDDITQRLAGLSIEIGLLRKKADPKTTAGLDRLQREAIQMTEDLRNIAQAMHPSLLELAGLSEALEALCRQISLQRNIAILCTAEGLPERLPEEISITMYRIAQEAIGNAVKHAGASMIHVRLRVASDIGKRHRLCLTVSDNGRGFLVDRIQRGSSLGLLSMEERVHLVKGSFAISSRPGEGCQVVVDVPLAEALNPVMV
jgi:signal transduction histidine kinase